MSVERNYFKVSYTENTKDMQEFKDTIETILSDGKIDETEVRWLRGWMDNHESLKGYYPFDKINSVITSTLEDDIITEDEYSILKKAFEDFLNPIDLQSDNNGSNNIDFENHIFCLTGDFINGSKDSVEEMIVSRGGECKKSVTKALDYLIVGGKGSDSWKFGNYGGKVQKAMEYIDKGSNIKIISEADFFKAIGESYNEQLTLFDIAPPVDTEEEYEYAICDGDTKSLRKSLNLPVTKSLRYVRKTSEGEYVSDTVLEYSIYSNNNGAYNTLKIKTDKEQYAYNLSDSGLEHYTLIHAMLFADMQKPSYIEEIMIANGEKERVVNNKIGQLLDAYPNEYTVVDIETTGLDPKSEEITELAAVRYRNGVEVANFSELVCVNCKIPEKVVKLTNITNDMVKDARPIKDVLLDFISFIGDDILLGQNIHSFDAPFINVACKEYLNEPLHNDYIDLLFISKKWLQLPKYSLKALTEYFGIDYSKAHRAVEDCRMTAEVYERIKRSFNHEDPDYIIKIREILKNIIKEKSLPEDSLRCRWKNENKGPNDYAIEIWEPEYPFAINDPHWTSFSAVLIKPDTTKARAGYITFAFPKSVFDKIGEAPDTAKIINGAKNALNITVCFLPDDPCMLEFVSKVVEYRVDMYISGASSFGCCSRFIECSDAGHCVHENRLYATACMYYDKLKNGIIYYGKNKNISQE